MKVEFVDAKGNTINMEAEHLTAADVDILNSEIYTRKHIRQMIDNMDISADAKSILNSIAQTTIAVGKNIIQIGKKILEIVLEILRKFPNASYGLILGLLLGMLVSGIPILGLAFGPFITPLAAAFGLASGWSNDLRDNALTTKIFEANERFSALR